MTRPDSIRSIGLQRHLNDNAYKYKNKGYQDFLEMLENRASINYMARAFGVTKNTVSKWLLIHYEEQEKRAKVS